MYIHITIRLNRRCNATIYVHATMVNEHGREAAHDRDSARERDSYLTAIVPTECLPVASAANMVVETLYQWRRYLRLVCV